MLLDQKIIELWDQLEKLNEFPKYVDCVYEFEWLEFSQRILGGDFQFITSIIKKLYSGSVIIIRSTLDNKEIEYIKNYALEFGKNNKPNFHKVLEGSPDFHRVATPEIAKQSGYSFYRVQHMYYFYRWNVRDSKKLFNIADKTWDVYKILCGWSKNSFKSATPKDGLVDRLHIHHYPSGTGEQELHQDPYLAQKIIMGHVLSEKGPDKDYRSGGIYYLNKNKVIIDIDSKLNAGDSYISFPLLVHGVARIDEHLPVNVETKKGRWFMGFYTLYSDYVASRHTGWAFQENLLKSKADTNE